MARYNTYHNGNQVIVVSTYAKKPVRGIAKCDPRDEYSHEFGEKLAKARCDMKVAEKRLARAQEKVNWYKELMDEVYKGYLDAKDYLNTAEKEFEKARRFKNEVLKEAGK